jgi:hypothetical protein
MTIKHIQKLALQKNLNRKENELQLVSMRVINKVISLASWKVGLIVFLKPEGLIICKIQY